MIVYRIRIALNCNDALAVDLLNISQQPSLTCFHFQCLRGGVVAKLAENICVKPLHLISATSHMLKNQSKGAKITSSVPIQKNTTDLLTWHT